MPGISDFSSVVYLVCEKMYLWLTDASYTDEESQIILDLRKIWREVFGDTIPLPPELQFDDETTATKKPKRKFPNVDRLLLESDFDNNPLKEFGDNILVGPARTAFSMVLSYLNKRKKRVLIEKGSSWDPQAQFCHLLAGFCFVIPKIDIDHPSAFNNLQKWLKFILLVQQRQIFQQGHRGGWLYDANDPTMPQVVHKIWILFNQMKTTVALIQSQRTSREYLRGLATSVRNLCHFSVELSGFFLAANPVPETLGADTIGNPELGGLPNYGAGLLDQHVLAFGKTIYEQLALDKEYRSVSGEDEKASITQSTSSLSTLDAIEDNSSEPETRVFYKENDSYKAMGLEPLDKDKTNSIYIGFRSDQTQLRNFYQFLYLTESLACLVKAIDVAFTISGEGGNLLVFYVLGNGLDALIKMLHSLQIGIKEREEAVYTVCNEKYRTVDKLPDKKKKTEDKIWLNNFRRVIDIGTGLHAKFEKELDNLNDNLIKIKSDFEKWNKCQAKQRKLQQIALHCAGFIKMVNQLGQDLENAGIIGYTHNKTINNLEQRLLSALRPRDIHALPPSDALIHAQDMHPWPLESKTQIVRYHLTSPSQKMPSTPMLTPKDRKNEITTIIAKFLKPILNVPEGPDGHIIRRVVFLTRWKKGMMSYKSIWDEKSGWLHIKDIFSNQELATQFKEGIYWCKNQTDKKLDDIIQYSKPPTPRDSLKTEISHISDEDAYTVMLLGGALQVLRIHGKVDNHGSFKCWRASIAELQLQEDKFSPEFFNLLKQIDAIAGFDFTIPGSIIMLPSPSALARSDADITGNTNSDHPGDVSDYDTQSSNLDTKNEFEDSNDAALNTSNKQDINYEFDNLLSKAKQGDIRAQLRVARCYSNGAHIPHEEVEKLSTQHQKSSINTLLKEGVKKGNERLLLVIRYIKFETFQENPLDIDIGDSAHEGYRAFHWAASSGNYAAITILAADGADPNIGNAAGYTPLATAIHHLKDSPINEILTTIKLLLDAGADPQRVSLIKDTNSELIDVCIDFLAKEKRKAVIEFLTLYRFSNDTTQKAHKGFSKIEFDRCFMAVVKDERSAEQWRSRATRNFCDGTITIGDLYLFSDEDIETLTHATSPSRRQSLVLSSPSSSAIAIMRNRGLGDGNITSPIKSESGTSLSLATAPQASTASFPAPPRQDR